MRRKHPCKHKAALTTPLAPGLVLSERNRPSKWKRFPTFTSIAAEVQKQPARLWGCQKAHTSRLALLVLGLVSCWTRGRRDSFITAVNCAATGEGPVSTEGHEALLLLTLLSQGLVRQHRSKLTSLSLLLLLCDPSAKPFCSVSIKVALSVKVVSSSKNFRLFRLRVSFSDMVCLVCV